jgi:serine/threonine-protein kinase PknG
VSCGRDGCEGHIVDGYCDLCGMAPRTVSKTEVIRSPWSAPLVPGSGPASEPRTSHATTPSGPSSAPSTAHRRLGRGLVSVPAVSIAAPEQAVMVDPQVPERNRYCLDASCKQPVGRSREGEPGRPEGYCRKCGTPFSFLPRLAAGALVAGQYEVLGCLGRGGMGWVYLARDRKVGFYVALKGVIHGEDESAKTAAVAERRLLAEIEHPNIVKIHNFVEQDGAEYIVMEFVNGVSLQSMLDARRERNGGAPDPLPVGEAIVYCLELLPALEYLHEHGLAFCDFKPDNAIRTANSLKLIDLGGGYRIGSDTPDIFGTPGYQAPEVARTGPTVASDLFTVGRTLAMLATDFVGYRGVYEYSLPPASEHDLYVRFDSLYRFLERATAFDPADRFQTASEMAGQLEGVLCEVAVSLASEAGESRTAARPSALFTPQSRGSNDGPDINRLPTPIVDPEDRHAGTILTMAARSPAEVVKHVDGVSESSVELDLWLVRALLALDRLDEATAVLEAIERGRAHDWRVQWYRGLVAMAGQRGVDATGHFQSVYRWLPGELAPKLALAMAAELSGDHLEAGRWYEVVTTTDDAFTSAAFGLARCRIELGDDRGAIAAYQRVPESSNSYVQARVAEVELLLEPDGGTAVEDALQAATIIESTSLERHTQALLSARVMESLLQAVCTGQHRAADASSVFGRSITEPELRSGLEATYRALARSAGSRRERLQLVDRANRVRPRSWL